MIYNAANASTKTKSLMGDYAMLLGDAVLRHRARIAEHSARIEAEIASRVKSEFIANMSHELRTPLNTIIGFSKILSEHDRRALAEPVVVEYSGLILDAANHLLAVINDILDISKIQSGRYTLHATDIAVDEIIHACLASLRVTAADARVTLKHRVALDLPLVRGDAVKLRQILTNLTSNAIKFTRAEGTVTIEAARTHDDGVVIIVEDNGVGMNEDEIQIALTPFGQVDGGRSRWREGTGLGLPIAKSLAELHGGTLEVSSRKGVGTRVSVHLPSRFQVSVVQARDALMGQETVLTDRPLLRTP